MNSQSSHPAGRGAILTALLAYCGVIVSLTMLKAFFMIGLLWQPENQRVRGLSLVPLNDLWESSSLFTQVFGYGGNFAFFVPFGVLAYLLVGRVGLTTLHGAGFSLLIEISQFAFQLGFSDIDDLLFNTLGAAAGAWIAHWAGPKAQWLWVALTAVVVLVFIVLVILGPRLGDPERVAEVNAASYAWEHGFTLRTGA
ncbi:VanZ family protein [Corynebacterium sp. L4756]|uniref:VanZ family protein n=1 Tax=unclassified Corynebacterium TaxID=2624378 RepID=UPI00374DF4DD